MAVFKARNPKKGRLFPAVEEFVSSKLRIDSVMGAETNFSEIVAITIWAPKLFKILVGGIFSMDSYVSFTSTNAVSFKDWTILSKANFNPFEIKLLRNEVHLCPYG